MHRLKLKIIFNSSLLKQLTCACLLILLATPININAQEQEQKKPEQNTEITTDKTTDSTQPPPATDNEVTTIIIDRSKINIAEPTSLEDINKADINHYINAEKVTPLLAGPDDFITLTQNETTANSKGVAILLPDWQQVATTPKSINYLRKILPEQGWTTITIQPPNKPDNYPSTSFKQQQRIDEDKATLEKYAKKLALMMTTVMEKAKNYPGIFIVIVEGNNAAMLTQLYQQEKTPPPNAFIALSSYALTTVHNNQYAQALAESDYPVLDLFLNNDHPLAISSAAQRIALAKKAFKPYYRQQQISNINSTYYPQEKLLKAINGWLKSIGW